MTTADWPNDDMLLELAAGTTPAQRLEWLEAALDFANAVGALEKTRRLELQDNPGLDPALGDHVRKDG